MANSKYKLTYYDWTGMAEIARLIFAFAKVPYEDERIPFKGNNPFLSPEMNARFAWGQVPVLEVDGVQIAQSRAIYRLLGKRFGLVGSNDLEAAKCDEIVDAMFEYLQEFQRYLREPDSAKRLEVKQNLLQVVTPKYLQKFDQIIKENGGLYLVGNHLTWADITVHNFLTYWEDFCTIKLYNNYPALKRAMEHFYNILQIKNWVENRPVPAMIMTDELLHEMVKNMNAKK